MHSHDKTLIARLGFADPDKKDPRHDLACQYLRQRDVANNLVSLIAPRSDDRPWMAAGEISSEFHITKGEGQYQTTIGFADLVIGYEHWSAREVQSLRMDHFVSIRNEAADRARQEVKKAGGSLNPLNPWEDHPAIRASLQEAERAFERLTDLPPDIKWDEARKRFFDQPTGADCSRRSAQPLILVEVKIKTISAAEVLRQLGLYQTYLRNACPVLVTSFELSTADVEMLGSKGVRHLRLGQGFETYCQQQRSQVEPAPSMHI